MEVIVLQKPINILHCSQGLIYSCGGPRAIKISTPLSVTTNVGKK
jgi:hypothetical protein